MAKHPGYGVIVKISVSSTLTAIAQVKDFKYPDMKKKLADVTTHDSSGGWQEWLDTGKKEWGKAKMVLEWDKSAATHAAITTAFNSASPVNMSFSDKDGSEIIAVPAHIETLGRTSEQEGAYTCEVEIQPTGAPTITP